MIRQDTIRFTLKSIQTLFSPSDNADPKRTHNTVLAKWKDHYDRYRDNGSRGRQCYTLSYLLRGD